MLARGLARAASKLLQQLSRVPLPAPCRRVIGAQSDIGGLVHGQLIKQQ